MATTTTPNAEQLLATPYRDDWTDARQRILLAEAQVLATLALRDSVRYGVSAILDAISEAGR